jgi:ATP-binding cassette subfamily F protein uup
MARESNLLILDEPTNDLDIETLDLLQDILGEYDGTVLLVSHDRDFLDRVATTTIAMEGNGQAVVYAGGWSDYRAQRGGDFFEAKEASKPLAKKEKQAEKKTSLGLSFTEKHRLEELPGVIDQLTAEITKLEELLADPELFTKHPVKFQKATDALVARQNALSDAEEEWLMLEEKAG